MCGIAGLFKLNGAPWDGLPKDLPLMLSAITHRGPDSRDVFVDGPIAMGVNRLSIIDPKPRSNQPLSSACGRFTIAFNGEIYNFRELREQLTHQGYSFATKSDTEVVLALYEQKGPDCLDAFRGMFGFAIWDRREQSLFIARDRLGEKPLVYYKDDHVFVFASELPGILASPRVPRRVNPEGIHSVMHYMHTVAPLSPFKDIAKLAPAHYLTIDQKDFKTNRYWQCKFDPKEQFTDERECVLELRQCFDDTVSLMSRCDAPVGALLSGGLDSSTVVASMSRVLKGFPTFRISGQKGPASEKEKASAHQVAKRYGSRHYEFDLDSRDFNLFAEVVRHHGEPIATAVPFDAFLISKEMKQHVKVALCGAGADELFGGYTDHQLLHIADIHFNKWQTLGFSANGTPPTIETEEDRMAWDLYKQFGPNQKKLVFPSMKYNDQPVFEKIFSKRMLDIGREINPVNRCVAEYEFSGAQSMFDAFICQQLNCVSQYSTTEINDRMGMAHSIEIRSPYLDVNMVELALKIPPQFKVSSKLSDPTSKRIMRRAMQDRLPQATINCEKMGFGGTVPYDQWLKEDCAAFIEAKLASTALADSGLFNMRGIQELYTLYQCGVKLNRDIFIGLISTAIWMETYF